MGDRIPDIAVNSIFGHMSVNALSALVHGVVIRISFVSRHRTYVLSIDI